MNHPPLLSTQEYSTFSGFIKLDYMVSEIMVFQAKHMSFKGHFLDHMIISVLMKPLIEGGGTYFEPCSCFFAGNAT